MQFGQRRNLPVRPIVTRKRIAEKLPTHVGRRA
jgi:hypothetical protein